MRTRTEHPLIGKTVRWTHGPNVLEGPATHYDDEDDELFIVPDGLIHGHYWVPARECAEVRAGVLAEEPEWEKRYEHLKSHAAVAMVTLNGDPYGYRSPSNREAAELLATGLGVPVKQEGTEE